MTMVIRIITTAVTTMRIWMIGRQERTQVRWTKTAWWRCTARPAGGTLSASRPWWKDKKKLKKKYTGWFLDALASLDFKLSVTEWVSEWVIDIFFTASASTGLSDLFSHKHTYYFKWIKVWLMTAIDWKHFKIEICNVRTYLRPPWCPSFSGSCTPEFQPEKSTSTRFQYCCLKKDTFERALSSPWVFQMLAHNEERNRCHPSTRR